MAESRGLGLGEAVNPIQGWAFQADGVGQEGPHMNLMTLIRLPVLIAIGWTVVAMSAGVLGVGAGATASPTYFIPRPSFHDAVSSARAAHPGCEEFHLVDRTTGRIDPFPVPADDRWELFSVSPWRDREGNLEAVGRWIVRRSDARGQASCGLGLFRLTDGVVKSRIALDVLPTGRPCWVPGRPRERKPAAILWQLRSATLEIDGKTGKPRISPLRSTSHVLDDGLAPTPLIVSADGQSVYASAGDGRIVTYGIPP